MKKRRRHYPNGRFNKLGTPEEVRPGVYRLTLPLPFTTDHVNVWALKGDDGWTFIDTGLDDEPSRRAWRDGFSGKLKADEDNLLLITHHHIDHMGLSGWLESELGLRVATTRGELGEFDRYRHLKGFWDEGVREEYFKRVGLGASERESYLKYAEKVRRELGELPRNPEVVEPGIHLELPGRTLTPIVVAGHSPEQLTLYDEARGLWFSGDHIMTELPAYVALRPGDSDVADPLTQFLKSLETLAQLPADTLVLPAHGAPFIGLHDRLDHLKKRVAIKQEGILKALERPMSVMEVARAIYPPKVLESSVIFVAGDMSANLSNILNKGELVRHLTPEGVALYHRA